MRRARQNGRFSFSHGRRRYSFVILRRNGTSTLCKKKKKLFLNFSVEADFKYANNFSGLFDASFETVPQRKRLFSDKWH